VQRLHVWLGLVSAVGVVVVSLTGIMLNHRESLGLGHEGPPTVEGTGEPPAVLPLYDLLVRAARAADDAGVRIVTLDSTHERPNNPGDVNRVQLRPSTATAQVRFNDRRNTEFVLDWSTGKVLDIAPRDDATVERVHSGELLGQRGVIVGDLVAAALVLLALSGAFAWLRRLRARRRAFPPGASRWSRANWWFHLVGGLLATAYLVVLSVTGVLLNHKRELHLMVEPVVIADDDAIERSTAVPFEQLVAWGVEARDAAPGAYTMNDVRFVDWRPESRYAKIRFNDDYETILDVYDKRVYASAQRRDRWVEDLHSGVMFGARGTWLSDLTASFLIVLTLNGMYLWLAPTWRARTFDRKTHA
jgi:uncharacterized iron-regulated membrane protein